MSISTLVNQFKRFLGIQKKEYRQNLLSPTIVNERNRKIRELREQNKMLNINATKKQACCPICHTDTYLFKCSKCGKEACHNCLVFDPRSNKYYCEDCWSES